MKTAMKELFERLDFIFYTEVSKEKEWWDMFKNEHLEKEKDQIKNAWISGNKYLPYENPDEYYNQTYNQNK